jgi:hypothetical protein
MSAHFLIALVWIAAAAILGFVISYLFAGKMHLPRREFLIPYLLLAGVFLNAFYKWEGLNIGDLLRRNWIWGLVGAVVIGVFTVRNILSQPRSGRSNKLLLAWDIIWLGIVYGCLDALFLSVLPVLAVWQAFASFDWSITLWGKILVGVIALIASLLVTIAYHLGYPEYRAKAKVMGPLIGNGVMSLGYIFTVNPFTAVLPHIAMHIAGVLRGPESVIQLPPHHEQLRFENVGNTPHRG